MAGILNGSLKGLKSKEKITIVTGMSALAVLLVGVIVLLAYCTGANHTHRYDYNLVFMDGKLNLSGHCKVLACQDPLLYIEDVDAEAQVIKSATCLEEGEVEYSYSHKGNVVKCTVATAKSGHMLEGYEMNLNKKYDVINDIKANNIALDVNIKCGSLTKASFNCDNCHEKFEVFVSAEHKYYYDVKENPTAHSAGKAYLKCENHGCIFGTVGAVLTLPKIQPGINADLVQSDVIDVLYVKYHYKPSDTSIAWMPEIIIEKLEYNP